MLKRLHEKQINASTILENAGNRSYLPVEVGIITYQSKIRPILEYASPVWPGLPNYMRDEIDRVQSRSLRILGLEKDYLPSLSQCFAKIN
jgi:hypothetical protein